MSTTASEIDRLLRAQWSNRAIAQHLACSTKRIARRRFELGIGNKRGRERMYPTLSDAWYGHVEWTGEGHARWLGPYTAGSPVLHHVTSWSARRVGFELYWGREARGPVRPRCDVAWCVAPWDVEDPQERKRRRAAEADECGAAMPARCAHGHDMEEWGRWRRDGLRPYCVACAAAPPTTPEMVREAIVLAVAGGPADDLPFEARREVAVGLRAQRVAVPVIAQRLGVSVRTVWRYLGECRGAVSAGGGS